MSRAVASLAAAMAVAVTGPAVAAVRQCGDIVSSEVVRAPTELEAKKIAIDQWHAKASNLGAGTDSWRLAVDRSLKCFPKDQGFECVAFGRPCIIDQTPNTPVTPPGGKGQGI
jgi:hypothetical protein